ncbi:MAG: hypothetical protein N2234_06140 [Planctomycetota bacterium]|nr:hypothetical protein [Planctomycetota bacterium]
MRAIKVKCISCKRKVLVQESQAGRWGRCPHCSEKMRVPPLVLFEMEGVECERCKEKLSVGETLHIVGGHIYCATCFSGGAIEYEDLACKEEATTKRFEAESGMEEQEGDRKRRVSADGGGRASIRRRVVLDCEKSLASLLQSQNLLSKEQYSRARTVQRETGEGLISILVNLGYCEEQEIGNALSKAKNLPFSTAKTLYVDRGVIDLLPTALLESYELIPLSRSIDTITVAMVNPLDNEAVEEIEHLTGLRGNIIICTLSGFRQTFSRYFT